MASIKDVAKLANVSIATVSNAIHKTKPVSKELKLRIDGAISELSYEINPIARGLKRKSTLTIGVVVTDMNRIFFPQVIKGIHDYFTKAGYSLSFFDTNDNLDKERDVVKTLKSNWVDGIIIDSVADTSEQDYFNYLAQLKSNSKKIPVVSIERDLTSYQIDSIIVDNFEGGHTATQHLINLGCKEILHISGPLSSCIVKDRINGYRSATKNVGLKEHIVNGNFSPMSGYKAMKDVLLSGAKVDGVFAANDQMAIGAIKALREHGRKIPEDVKVVGFDNIFIASMVNPSLTSVNVPKYQMGQFAAKILHDRFKDSDLKIQTKKLPSKLITRQSTDLDGDQTWELFGW